MRALVTGACGFVGGYLVRYLQESKDEVFATYLVKPSSGLDGCQSAHLDICDPKQCADAVAAYRPEVIYHLAGLSFPPDAEKDFGRALAINVGGTFNVLNAAQQLGPTAKVVLISSAQVYGKSSAQLLPLRESAPLNPADNYSLSKVLTETTALRFSDKKYFSTIIMRPFNHIGAGQRQDFAVSNFAFQLAQIANGLKEPVLKVGNLAAKRDFTDVRDIVRGYRLAAEKGKGIYNLCSGVPVSMQEILERLIRISGLKVTLEQDASRMRASDTPELYGSADKAKEELGWTMRYDLDASLRHTYEHWLKFKDHAG